MINWQETKAAIFRSNKKALKPIREIDIPNLELLVGLKRQKELLYENTDKFIKRVRQTTHFYGGREVVVNQLLQRPFLANFMIWDLELLR